MPQEAQPKVRPEGSTSTMVLMFTDVVGSVAMKTRLGTACYTRQLGRHDALFRRVVALCEGAQIRKDLGDGFLARFPSTAEAVSTALRFQHGLAHEPWEREPVRVRVGLHLGEVTEMADRDEGHAKLVGLGADMAARVMGLALPGQILLTRPAFDAAREVVAGHPEMAAGDAVELRWIAHGPYLMQGADETIDVFEVGGNGIAPLCAPPSGDKARRAVPAGEEELFGWRPAVGLPVPGRLEWTLERRLGEGGFGEVWLARHRETSAPLVFKFCFDADRLRSLRRELAIFRLVEHALGDREDIARIRAVQVKQPPFFLESEFTEHGDVLDWAEQRGGIASVSLATRLRLVAEVATAAGAAHSVGILHKDIKPSNVLIYTDEEGQSHARLADFGIGTVLDTTHLLRHDITVVGFTETSGLSSESTLTGTRLYAPPETLAGKPFTVQGDVYALGVMLYQMVVGDLRRPLAQGWERDVTDPLLREDIADCVAGRPLDRLATAGALVDRLTGIEQRRRAGRAARKRTVQLQRRRRLVRALGLGSVALIVLLAVVGWRLLEEQDLRQEAETLRAQAVTAHGEAEAARVRAEAVSRFLNEDLLGAVDPRHAQGRQVTVREVLDTAATAIEGRFEDQPLVEAELRQTIGSVYLGVERYAEARKHLERALVLKTALVGEESLQVAETLETLALLASAGEGEQERALQLAQRVARIRAHALGEEHALTMRAQADVGMYTALAAGKLVAGIDNPLMLGMLAKVRGRGEDAATMRTELIRMIYEVERLWGAGDRETLFAFAEKVAAPFLADKVFRERVPWAWSAFALHLQRDGQPAAAAGLGTVAVEIGRRHLGEGHPMVVQAMSLLGSIFREQRRPAQAEPYLAKAARLYGKTLGETNPRALSLRHEHAVVLLELQRYAEAESEALELHRLRGGLDVVDPEDLAEAVELLVSLYEGWGKPDKANVWRKRRAG